MADFGTIKTEVQTLLIDAPTAVSSLVGSWVNRAVRKLQSKHNFKVMEAEETFITTTLVRTLGTRPSDWKQPRGNPYYLEDLGGFREMMWVSDKANAFARWGSEPDYDFGDPMALYEDDLAGEFLVFPFPDALSDFSDGEYRVTVPYWKYLGNLIADSDTNWFTTNAEQWIIYQAVSEGFFANEDEQRAQLWRQRALGEYADTLLLDKHRRLGETQTFVPHTGARMPHTQE